MNRRDLHFLLIKGAALYDKGNFVEARQIYLEIINKIENKGFFKRFLGLFSQQATKRDATAYFGLANCEYSLGNHKKAYESIQKAWEYDPDDSQIGSLLSRLITQLKDESSKPIDAMARSFRKGLLGDEELHYLAAIVEKKGPFIPDWRGVLEKSYNAGRISSGISLVKFVVEQDKFGHEKGKRKGDWAGHEGQTGRKDQGDWAGHEGQTGRKDQGGQARRENQAVWDGQEDPTGLEGSDIDLISWLFSPSSQQDEGSKSIYSQDTAFASIVRSLEKGGGDFPQLWLAQARINGLSHSSELALNYYKKAGLTGQVLEEAISYLVEEKDFEKAMEIILSIATENSEPGILSHAYILAGRVQLAQEMPRAFRMIRPDSPKCFSIPRDINQEAIKYFEKAEKTAPYSPETSFYSSVCAISKGEYTSAFSYLDRIRPSPIKQCLMGQVYLESGNVEGALSIFQGLESEEKKNPVILLFLGRCYRLKGWLDEAVDAFSEAYHNGSDISALFFRGEALSEKGWHSIGLDSILQALTLKWDSKWGIRAAQIARLAGRPDEAALLVKRAIDEGVPDKNSSLLLAMSLWETKRGMEASVTLVEALKNFPKDPDLSLLLAEIMLVDLNNPKGAIKALDGINFYEAQKAKALEINARAHFAVDDFVSAVNFGTLAMESGSLRKGLLVLMADAKRRIGDLKGAANILEEYLGSENKDARATFLMGRLYFDMGDLDGAEKYLNQSLGIREMSEAFALMARIRFDKSQYEMARQFAESAFNQDANCKEAVAILLNIFLNEQKYGLGLIFSAKISPTVSKDPDIALLLSKLYFYLGHWDLIEPKKLESMGQKDMADCILKEEKRWHLNFIFQEEGSLIIGKIRGRSTLFSVRIWEQSKDLWDYLPKDDIPLIHSGNISQKILKNHRAYSLENLLLLAFPDREFEELFHWKPEFFKRALGGEDNFYSSQLYGVNKAFLVALCLEIISSFPEKHRKLMEYLGIFAEISWDYPQEPRDNGDIHGIYNKRLFQQAEEIGKNGEDDEIGEIITGWEVGKNGGNAENAENQRLEEIFRGFFDGPIKCGTASFTKVPLWDQIKDLAGKFYISHPGAPDNGIICRRLVNIFMNLNAPEVAYDAPEEKLYTLFWLELFSAATGGIVGLMPRGLLNRLDNPAAWIAQLRRRDGFLCDSTCPFRDGCKAGEISFSSPYHKDNVFAQRENIKKPIIAFGVGDHYSGYEMGGFNSFARSELEALLKAVSAIAQTADPRRSNQISLDRNIQSTLRFAERVFQNIDRFYDEYCSWTNDIILVGNKDFTHPRWEEIEKYLDELAIRILQIREDLGLLIPNNINLERDLETFRREMDICSAFLKGFSSPGEISWIKREKEGCLSLFKGNLKHWDRGFIEEGVIVADSQYAFEIFSQSSLLPQWLFGNANIFEKPSLTVDMGQEKRSLLAYNRLKSPSGGNKSQNPYQLCQLSEIVVNIRQKLLDKQGYDGFGQYYLPLARICALSLFLKEKKPVLPPNLVIGWDNFPFAQMEKGPPCEDKQPKPEEAFYEWAEYLCLDGKKADFPGGLNRALSQGPVIVDDLYYPCFIPLAGAMASAGGKILLFAGDDFSLDNTVKWCNRRGFFDIVTGNIENLSQRVKEGPNWLIIVNEKDLRDPEILAQLREIDFEGLIILGAYRISRRSPYHDRITEKAVEILAPLLEKEGLKALFYSPLCPQITANWAASKMGKPASIISVSKKNIPSPKAVLARSLQEGIKECSGKKAFICTHNPNDAKRLVNSLESGNSGARFIISEPYRDLIVPGEWEALIMDFVPDRPEDFLFLSQKTFGIRGETKIVLVDEGIESSRYIQPHELLEKLEKIVNGDNRFYLHQIRGQLGRELSLLEEGGVIFEKNILEENRVTVEKAGLREADSSAIDLKAIRKNNFISRQLELIYKRSIKSRNPVKTMRLALSKLDFGETIKDEIPCEGQFLIMGPPNSGKTHKLINHAHHLIENWHVPPQWLGIITSKVHDYQGLSLLGAQIISPAFVYRIKNQPYILVDDLDIYHGKDNELLPVLFSGFGNIVASWDSLSNKAAPDERFSRIILDENWSSSRNIVDGASDLLEYLGLDRLEAKGPRGGKITVIECESLEEEASICNSYYGNKELIHITDTRERSQAFIKAGALRIEALESLEPYRIPLTIISGFNSSFGFSGPQGQRDALQKIIRFMLYTEKEIIFTWSKDYADQGALDILEKLSPRLVGRRKGFK